MSKLEAYRRWCAKHHRESVGFDLADPAIAELEAENKSQVEKTIEARQETHLAIIQKREAEARIAALEAENKQLRLTQPLYSRRQIQSRLEQAEAEVEKYKWQRDECADELGRKLAVDYEHEATKPFAASDVIVDLNRRWDERGTQ